MLFSLHKFKGGIHPDPSKHTAGFPIVELAKPATVTLILHQSIGAPAEPIVKVGDHVEAWQKVASRASFISAAVHTPISGTVKKIGKVRDAYGIAKDAIVIENDSPDAMQTPTPFPHSLTEHSIPLLTARGGVVGLGGACFPTAVKLSIPDGKRADTIIINAAECEPYLTCDDALMLAYSKEIIGGVKLIMQATGAHRAIIGIEDNKPRGAAALRDAIGPRRIEVKILPTRYPQGSEKQLIYALTGRVVGRGFLPIDVGCIVDNVATAYALYKSVCEGEPLVSRVITVDGPSLRAPGNYLVEIGTPISAVLEAAGGIPDDTGKIIAGGPMMGRAISNIDAPTTKGLSGIIVFPESMAYRKKEDNCIRCARCVRACPMGLEPYLIAAYGEYQLGTKSAAAGAMNCLECGCCAYVCPSHRRLIDYIRMAKRSVRSISPKP